MKDEMGYAFTGKTIVISGSSKGIGKTLARTIGLMGGNMVINGSNADTLTKTHNEFVDLKINCIAVTGNVAVMNDCVRMAQAALDAFGGIDVLIANAGLSAEGSLEDSDPNVFKQLMDINYLGTVFLIKACISALKKTKGYILITGSVSGLRGIPGFTAYSASKMALTALAEGLAIELSCHHVQVGIVYVGFTENDPQKIMLNANGEVISKMNVARGKIASQYDVALEMIDMVAGRSSKKVLSLLGVINHVVTRFAPWIATIFFKRFYLKKQLKIKHVTAVPMNASS